MEAGAWSDTGKGTPQGAIVSPVRANIYLHYVFDWWTKRWRRTQAGGEVLVVLYAEDLVVGFQPRREAERYREDRTRRRARFGWERHPTQTRLIEFGRYVAAHRKGRGWGKPEPFGFMGRTHFCTTTRRGAFRLGRKPARKRATRTIRQIREWLRQRWSVDQHDNARWWGRVIQGWLHY